MGCFFKLALCLAFLMATTLSVAYSDSIRVVNDEADKVISQLNNHIIAQGEDSSSIGSLSTAFEIKVGFLPLHGKIVLTNGNVHGRATLQRVNDCTAESTENGYNIVLSLTFTGLTFDYDYGLRFLGTEDTGRLHASLKDSIHTFKINVIKGSGKTEAHLQEHINTNEGDLDINASGSKLPDFVLNHLKKPLVDYLKPYSSQYTSEWLQNGIQEILESWNQS